MYFLPEWYLEDRKVKRKKSLKVFISIFIIIDLILMEMLFVNTNKKKLLDNEINQRLVPQKKDSEQMNETKGKNNRTLDTFLTYITSVQEKDNYESIYIDGRRIELNLDSTKLDYKLLIKEIEMKNKFVIKQILFLSGENPGNIKINMELK
jgi:hypothetical protein